MKKKTITVLLLAALCLALFLSFAQAETRQGVIALEGQEETIEETLFESPQGFSFWYASERLEAYPVEVYGIDGVCVAAMYSDDYMILSMISEEEAREYAADLGMNIVEQAKAARVQRDVYRRPEDGTYQFLTLIAEYGRYFRAMGEYSVEAAEGNAKFFQRVLDSISLISAYDEEMLSILPGSWAEEYEGAGTVLMLEENGKMSLSCYSVDGSFAYTCQGTWSYTPIPGYGSQMTLLFTSTDNPSHAGSAYSVECVYEAYTESWVENDTLITCLILNPPVRCSGVSPFEEVYGENDAALSREQGPNMRVVKCKEFVSLREERSTSAKRLVKVPLGALVLAFPEYGEENGFIYCVYHDEEVYILAEYLQPVE